MPQVGNVSDVFEAAKAKREADTSDEAFAAAVEDCRERSSVTKLEKVWRIACLRNNSEAFVEKWSQRERGRANHIVREMNGIAAAQLVAEVVAHWNDFVRYLTEHAHRGVGDRPHIGLLAHHRGVAVEWLQARASACAEEEEDGPSWDF